MLTLNEQILLLSIWRLNNNAYGVTIRDMVMDITQRSIVYGTLYNSLDKLVQKGYVITNKGEPTKERGGRGKIYYQLTDDGKDELQKSKELQARLWEDVPHFVFGAES